MSTSDDGPLPDTLQATLKAEVDASKLNNQIRGLINNKVKHAVENSFGVVMKNVTDQLKEGTQRYVSNFKTFMKKAFIFI